MFRVESTIIDLSDIASTEKLWTKVFNLIPMMPNSLAVKFKNGEEHRLYYLKKRLGNKN